MSLTNLTSLVAIAILLTGMNARAADPEIHWQKLETAHFTLVFDSRHHPLAQAYAVDAEQAWASVAPAFGLWPEKTVIVIDDETDLANGAATGVPYPIIQAYPVLPTALDPIGDYGAWGLELITHEYTHILTFEPATGVMRPLRWIFGSIIRPNLLLPRWYTEGLAVEFETRYSNFGRLRSANYLSIVRAMVEEGTLSRENLSRINEVSIPDWPGGIRPYLMGALLWDEMVRLKGDKVVEELNTAHSRRLPFLINAPPETIFGLNYQALLDKVYLRAETNAKLQLEIIRKGNAAATPPDATAVAVAATPAVPVAPTVATSSETKQNPPHDPSAGVIAETKLDQRGFFSHSPVVSPDGHWLAFVGKEHNFESVIFLSERTSKEASFALSKSRRALDGTAITRVAWLPDSSGFIYDNIKTFERYYQYSDLWRYDVASGTRTQITKGLRAREATVSPDGKSLVFIQNRPGSTRLVATRIDGSNLRVLYEPGLESRISRPEFLSPCELITTERAEKGEEVFRIFALKADGGGAGDLELDEPKPRTVLEAYKPVHFPRVTAEGLLFVSDRSGVANIYLADRELTGARALTNGTTRIITGELDPINGELLYGRLQSAGPQVFASTREAWRNVPDDPPQVGPLVDSQFPSFRAPQVEVKAAPEDYSSLPYLLPRYWLPYAYLAPEGIYVQASTAANDPTGRHAYALTASYDSLTSKPSFYGTYANRTTHVPFTLSALDLNEYIYSGAFNRQTLLAQIEGSSYVRNLSNDWQVQAGYTAARTDVFFYQLLRGGPNVGFTWANATQRGLEISPVQGASVSLNYSQYLRALGELEYSQTDFHGTYYFSRWLPERHALAFSLNASIAPNLDNVLLGRTTIGGTYTTALLQTAFVMRGYGSGSFLGNNLVTTTAEYRFPIRSVYKGKGSWPIFVQKLHGDLFVDALTEDGRYYDFDIQRYRAAALGTFFIGTGAEVKIDATLFYHLPIQFILGAYYGTDRSANPRGLFPFIGFGL